jgi:hypothetical protein
MPEITITEWDPSTMAPDATILIVGKRHTGKTTLTRDLMTHMKETLDLVVGMNPTEMGNHNLEFFTPPAFIFHSFDDEKLHHILDWQRRSVANNKGRKVGFIMDDCMSETSGGGAKKKKVMSSGDISRVFKIGRHLKIFYVCTMQYICDAPPEIRGNVDLLFVFNTTSGLEREKLWKDYFAQFPKYKDFCKVFDACAMGFDCLVLDTRKAATGKNCIFYYRAKLIDEPFRVGKPVFWKLSNYYFQDRTDYSMDAGKVLGMLPRQLGDDNTEDNTVDAGGGLFIKKVKS